MRGGSRKGGKPLEIYNWHDDPNREIHYRRYIRNKGPEKGTGCSVIDIDLAAKFYGTNVPHRMLLIGVKSCEFRTCGIVEHRLGVQPVWCDRCTPGANRCGNCRSGVVLPHGWELKPVHKRPLNMGVAKGPEFAEKKTIEPWDYAATEALSDKYLGFFHVAMEHEDPAVSSWITINGEEVGEEGWKQLIFGHPPVDRFKFPWHRSGRLDW